MVATLESANERSSLPSDLLRESLAAEVARAAAGLTNIALARRAGLSPRTLRAILDPYTSRRFGRATLDKLDGPLSWPEGRAWTIYTAQLADGAGDAGPDREAREMISLQMAALMLKLEQFDHQPDWAGELIEACRPLDEADRAAVLAMVRRLASR